MRHRFRKPHPGFGIYGASDLRPALARPYEKTVDLIYLATKGSYAGATHGRGQWFGLVRGMAGLNRAWASPGTLDLPDPKPMGAFVWGSILTNFVGGLTAKRQVLGGK